MKSKIFILQLLLQMTLHSHAQEICGTVTDSKKEPLVSATVIVTQNGKYMAGVPTDFDGNYSIKLLDPGYYDVRVTYLGFDTLTMKGVVVNPSEKTGVNFTMKLGNGQQLKDVILHWKKKPVDKYKHNTILTAQEIKSKPTTLTTDLVAITPGINQNQRSQAAKPAPANNAGNVYIVDGIQVQGATGMYMSQGATQQTNMELQGKPVYLDPSQAEYKKVAENDFRMVKSSPLSTMSVDVDRASYSNVRRFITNGELPPADAVRVEEMVNYFDYQYPAPQDNKPVAIQSELTWCPWNRNHILLRIGMQAKKMATAQLPPSNLVFLIDVSGSMDEPDRLPLVKSSLKLLVNKLRKEDLVSLVVYAGQAGLVLPATHGDKKQVIIEAIDHLQAGGSTAGGAGIELAYKTAATNFIKGGNNRVILATDGDFNVGVSSDNELEELITKKRSSGIFLTCIGVGDDNYKDSKMELLADKGNGNYDYIDNIKEAEKMLVKEFTGTLFTVAKDVKAQIEFNPQKVQSYRLIGYENRVLNTEDFRDDKKDAGDMGIGHMVTILYELVPAGACNDEQRPVNELKYQQQKQSPDALADETATIRFRYKDPADSISKEMAFVVSDQKNEFAAATGNTRFAASVALFGMILKGSAYKGTGTFSDVLKIANESKGEDMEGYRTEFINLVTAAKAISQRTSAK